MKSPTTIAAEALVTALDNRDRAERNLRNAVAISEEDASIDRDKAIADALTAYNSACWAASMRMEARVAPPQAPGTEEPHPEEAQPGEAPASVPADPAVPKKDKVPAPPAQPTEVHVDTSLDGKALAESVARHAADKIAKAWAP